VPSKLNTRKVKAKVRLTFCDHLNVSSPEQFHTKSIYLRTYVGSRRGGAGDDRSQQDDNSYDDVTTTLAVRRCHRKVV